MKKIDTSGTPARIRYFFLYVPIVFLVSGCLSSEVLGAFGMYRRGNVIDVIPDGYTLLVTSSNSTHQRFIYVDRRFTVKIVPLCDRVVVGINCTEYYPEPGHSDVTHMTCEFDRALSMDNMTFVKGPAYVYVLEGFPCWVDYGVVGIDPN